MGAGFFGKDRGEVEGGLVSIFYHKGHKGQHEGH